MKTCHKIAKERGYPDLFDRITLEENAIRDTGEIIKFRLENNRNPNSESKDSTEKKLDELYKTVNDMKKGVTRADGRIDFSEFSRRYKSQLSRISFEVIFTFSSNHFSSAICIDSRRHVDT